MTATKIEAVNDKLVKVTIKIDADCRIGEHFLQLRTRYGISDFRSFHVGEYPSVADKEPNNDFAVAQAIQQEVTIDGVIKSGDVDLFSLEAEEGQRLSVEIQAMRLGHFFDPLIELYDSNEKLLLRSDDSPFGKQDGFFSITIAQTGKYFVKVRDIEFGGSGQSSYRLHVGTFIRPSVVFPSGGKIGEKTKLTLIGDQRNDFDSVETEIVVGNSPNEALLGLPTELRSPTPPLFRAVGFGNQFEKEPNNSFKSFKISDDDLKREVATPPIALNGVISESKDIDFFQFAAKKGRTYTATCFANRIGSGLDPILNVFSPDRKSVVRSDDFGKNPDSYLQFKAMVDGNYFMRVRDHRFRGRLNFVYRIEIEEVQPEISFGIKRIDRFSQQRQVVAVPQGGRYAVLFTVKKSLTPGPIELDLDSLPLDIQAKSQPLQNGTNLMPVVFEADENAELAGTLYDLTGTYKNGEKESVVGHFGNRADFSLGPPNNSLYASGTIDRLPMAVVEPLPFSVELKEPEVPLVRNGSMGLPIVVTRKEGFDAAIRVEMLFRPPGVGARGYVNIPKGKSTGSYSINANDKALLGKWPICLIATANFNGPAWTSSNLKTLEVHEAFVTANIDRVSVERGQSVEIVCKLQHHFKFEGTGTAKLLGLPPNVAVIGDDDSDSVSFDATENEIRFKVVTNDKSPIGKQTSMFCQLSIPKNGQQMVSKAAKCTLLIRPTKKKQNNVASKVSKQEAE